ncbi:sterol carrier protein [Aquibacillus halophilus]|uniref:Sterol carrier protein n=1 Tax=Aquibacillus halophilus TaxID=930132 RepID=A0A6A8DC31_9BACI|nr:SCP2 sterol-binding domain-containing protein [Aquibacillus halophilus]MRH41331.1 sterol carrier protein [Aquibacillus halophilus]
MAVKEQLMALVDKMNAYPEHIKDEKNRIYQINLEESGPIQIVVKDGQVEVREGFSDQAEVTLILSDESFSKLLKDDLNTTMAFMTGKLKVEGKVGLALKLQETVKKYQ